MYVTGTFHPPAGINPLLVVSNNLPWSFLLAPVLAGALLLTLFAYVWHRWIRRRPWPQRWLQDSLYEASASSLRFCRRK